MPERSLAGRLFLAVPFTTEVRSGLVRHLDAALDGRSIPGRSVAPESWHMTLRFLGDTSWEAYEVLLAALGEADLGQSFTLGFSRLGAFPRPERTRVLWLGTKEGVDELRALAAVVERCAVAAGFEPDERRFSAHLTLSRLRPEQNVSALVAAVPPFPLPLPVSDVVLYRSHLSRSGASYEALNRFELAATTLTAR